MNVASFCTQWTKSTRQDVTKGWHNFALSKSNDSIDVCHSNWFNLIVENFHVFYKLSCFQCFFAPYNEVICDQSCVHLQCNSSTLLNCSFDIFSIFPFGLIFLASLNNHHLFFWHHWFFIGNIISFFFMLIFYRFILCDVWDYRDGF